MKHRTNIRLDDQARADAQQIMKEYNIGSVSAAVRFALREVARKQAAVGSVVGNDLQNNR